MPVTPFKRDQQQSSSPARSSPLRSSPLNPQYRLNNPPSQRRASSSNHFHVQSRYVRPTANVTGSGSTLGASSSDQNPQKALWRERFRQKCAERVERDRAKYQTATRQRSGTSLGLSDGDMSSEGDEMDVEDGDAMDDSVSECLTSLAVTRLKPTNTLSSTVSSLPRSVDAETMRRKYRTLRRSDLL